MESRTIVTGLHVHDMQSLGIELADMTFIHAGETIVERELHDDTLRVGIGWSFAFQSALEYDIRPAGKCKSMLSGGDYVLPTASCDSDKVWLQSVPTSRMAVHMTAASCVGDKDAGGGVASSGMCLPREEDPE